MLIFGSRGHFHRLEVTGLQVAGMPKKKKGAKAMSCCISKYCQSEETPLRESRAGATACWSVCLRWINMKMERQGKDSVKMSISLKKEERYHGICSITPLNFIFLPCSSLPPSLLFYLSVSPIFASLALAFCCSLAFSLYLSLLLSLFQ